jgi:hypothetical protein
MTIAVHGVEVPRRKLCPLGPMTVMSSEAVFFLESVSRSVLFFLCGLSSLGENLDLLAGDGGASGVAFLLGGVVLEARARSICCNGQRRGEEGGGLVGLVGYNRGGRSGRGRWCGNWRASHLLGSGG